MDEAWLHSAVEAIDWPAVPSQLAGRMLGLLFQLERSQWMKPGEIQARQDRQLQSLLRHAQAHAPFHRERIPPSLLSWQGFSREAFFRLPVLTRADVLREYPALCATRIPAGHGEVTEAVTSGSTGQAIRYKSSSVAAYFWHAFSFRDHLWHRRDFDAKLMVMRVHNKHETLPNWFGDIGAGMIRTGPCVVVPGDWTVDRQIDCMLRERPGYILGYATNLRELFKEADRRGESMPWLREARSFGEAVPAHMRESFRARNVKLTDLYSAREAGYLALQCPDSEMLHVQSESALVEIIDAGGKPCAPGETGRVVVTPLHNFAMPLIRYEIGDFAEVGEPCRCGRGLPTLARVAGRTRNMLRMPDGTLKWPALGPSKLLRIAPISQFNVVQTSLHDVEIRLVADRVLDDGEARAVCAHFTEEFGHDFNWKIVMLDAISPRPGGKFEDFISEVA